MRVVTILNPVTKVRIPLKRGHKVVDRWYREAGIGTVLEVTKTVATIHFPGRSKIQGVNTWDATHISTFLLLNVASCPK